MKPPRKSSRSAFAPAIRSYSSLSTRNPVTRLRRHCILHAAASPTSLPDTDDPFLLLGLNEPTTDLSLIKRAYRRMALRYHPDTLPNTATDTEKKRANDAFARINAAYSQLTGKDSSSTSKGQPTGGARRTRTSSSSSSSASGRRTTNTNPNRRTSSATSTDWRDYIPNYGESYSEDYDTGGDSFGAIFADLFSSAATGGSGLFNDFIEFFEGNFDSVSNFDSDESLQKLLISGSIEEIRLELDDTQLLVQILQSKLSSLEDTLKQIHSQLEDNKTMPYSKRFQLEGDLAEGKAREKIVQTYLKKVQKRLLKLQQRQKELLEQRRSRSTSAGYGRSVNDATNNDSARQTTATASTNTARAGGATGTSTSNDPASSSSSTFNNRQGFGSSGRRRRRSSSRQDRNAAGTTTSEKSETAAPPPPPPPSSSSSSSRTSTAQTTKTAPRQSSSNFTKTSPNKSVEQAQQRPVPPHRRTSSQKSYYDDDRRRLRELRVEEEFDKLKKDLGL